MKRMFFLAALLWATATQAQQWHYGVKADLSLSAVNGKGMSSSMATGFELGVYANRTLTSKWSIQPELLYNQTNLKKADNFTTYYISTGSTTSGQDLYLSYISIPVLAKYKVTNALSVMAGPQYSYLIYANESLLKNGDDAFTKSSVNGVAGLQCNLGGVGFYGRYSFGLSDINNIDDRYSWKLNQLQFGVSVQLK